jgi:hypothetical protein
MRGIVIIVKVYKVGWIYPLTLRRCDLKWLQKFFIQFIVSLKYHYYHVSKLYYKNRGTYKDPNK